MDEENLVVAENRVKEEQNDEQTTQNHDTGSNKANEAVEEVATPVVRRRGRPKGWRKVDNLGEKTRKDSTIRTRCCVNTAMEFFHQKVFPLLGDEHITLLSQTPFLHLFAFLRGILINRPMIHHILLLWNKNEDCFKVKGKRLEFRPEEISLVMGLQFNGKKVTYKREELTQSVIRSRYFQPSGEISRNMLEERILDALREGSPAADVVSLLVMYLFTMILFPQANGSIPVHMFHYVDDLDCLDTYSWGKAVYWLLRDNIPKCAAWCHEMERLGGVDNGDTIYGHIVSQEGEVHNTNGKGKKSAEDANKACLSGCTIALMAWFFEHTSFTEVEIMTGAVPRHRNWRYDVIFSRQRLAREFDNMPAGIISCEALKPTPTEDIIFEAGFKASAYVSLVNQEKGIDKFCRRTLASLLKQMVPVYWKFKFPVSHFLMSQVTEDRLEELNYSAKRDAGYQSVSEGNEEIPPSTERTPCKGASRVETNSCTLTRKMKMVAQKRLKSNHETNTRIDRAS